MGGIQWGQNVLVAQFISQHPYTLGSCSFGSKLSIHTVCYRLSPMDLLDTCLFYLRHLKVKVKKSEIVQNVLVAQFISQHPYTPGSCPFGSKLSIHTVCYRLSAIDLLDTCLLYLGVVKVGINRSKSGKSDPTNLAIFNITDLILGLNTLYPSMTKAFCPIRPTLKLTLTSDALNFFPISTAYFGRPLARLLGLR